jgi:hypothetical protein
MISKEKTNRIGDGNQFSEIFWSDAIEQWIIANKDNGTNVYSRDRLIIVSLKGLDEDTAQQLIQDSIACDLDGDGIVVFGMDWDSIYIGQGAVVFDTQDMDNEDGK